MQYLVEEKYRLPQMNAVHVLPGIDEKEVRRRLLHDYNLEIGAGLGDLAGKIWRFGIMGYSCKMENVMLCLCALETVFADMGVDVHFGAAESAAYHAYAQNPTPDAAGEEGGGLTAGRRSYRSPVERRGRSATCPVYFGSLLRTNRAVARSCS